MKTESPYPLLVVRASEGDRILSGHPWVFQANLTEVPKTIADGAIVQVQDQKKRFLGTGFFNSKSKIIARLVSQEAVEINPAFFRERLQTALALRQKHMPGATSFRVINSEADFMSGLVVDKYEDILVIQTSSLGMDQQLPTLLPILQEMFSPRAIVEKNDSSFRKFEGMPERMGMLSGALDGPVTVKMNGIGFTLDVLSGHKTGLYLDQQSNYQLAAKLFTGQVLDCFTFLGGFALHAAKAGAAHVHGLDQSETAVQFARQNAKANGLDGKCSFETTNVFDWLKQETAVRPHERVLPKFDSIILDPPSFTRQRSAVGDALRGYKEIHLRALKLLKRGGTLATFCCSHHVDAVTFESVILSAAFDARRMLRRVATFSQSPDHPIIPIIPETEYLKGYAYEVVR